jgi:hypothetical protein
MKISTLPALALFALRASAAALPAASPEETSPELSELASLYSQIKNDQLEALEAENEALVKRGGQPTCHIGNLAIRRE